MIPLRAVAEGPGRAVADGEPRSRALADVVADHLVPDDATLEAGLRTALGAHGVTVSLASRRPTEWFTTYPTDLVRCEIDGRPVTLFCKFSAGVSHDAHGHRGGLDREIVAYEQVVTRSGLSAVRWYGWHRDQHDHVWLLLEHVEGSVRVNKTPDPGAMTAAAAWLGRFHAFGEERLREGDLEVPTYDLAYYRGWVERARRFAGPLAGEVPWFDGLCRRVSDGAGSLFEGGLTVIHGEFYPKNVLYLDGRILPVDWESIAVAPGEIDLASLVQGWPADVIASAQEAYVRARWSSAPDRDFGRRFEAAWIYLLFRWLGDRPEWTTSPTSRWYFDLLAQAGARLGLL